MARKIIVAYKKREAELITTVQRILEQMENNPDFPNPPAALAALKTLYPELITALTNAKSGDKRMMSIKNDKKAIVLSLLEELAEFVTIVSKDDRTLALGSGFDVPFNNGPNNEPPAIVNIKAQVGLPGEASIRCSKITNTRAYTYQYTMEPPNVNTEWFGVGSSLGNHTFKGLASDKRYWFRVMAIGTSGQTGVSPVVSMVIQ